MKINDDIYLRNIEDNEFDYKMLYKWCSNPKVYKYFEQRILSYEEIADKYKKRISSDCLIKTKIIIYKTIPIGLVQYYEMNSEDKSYFNLNKDNKVFSIDIFIGEDTYHNLGIGSTIINYISDYLLNDCEIVALTPERDNVNAIKCYQKCGFKIVKEYNYLDSLGNKTINTLMIKQ